MPKFMHEAQGNLDAVVRESLRQKIISGELDGGYHLSELKLSQEFSVSRTPIREALCALAADGLVEMVPHRGAFVAHAAPHTKTDQMTAYTLFMGLVAKLAAEKANIEMLMELGSAMAFSTEASNEAGAYIMKLENAMVLLERVANSPVLSEAVGMVKRRTDMNEVMLHAYNQRNDINMQLSLLLTSLKRKKADSAEKSMRQLVQIMANAYLASRKPASSEADAVMDAMGKSLNREYKRNQPTGVVS